MHQQHTFRDGSQAAPTAEQITRNSGIQELVAILASPNAIAYPAGQEVRRFLQVLSRLVKLTVYSCIEQREHRHTCRVGLNSYEFVRRAPDDNRLASPSCQS